jgi:flagellar assembly factor FliW
VVHQNPENPFRWLQSLNDGCVAFPVMDPWQFKPEYNPSISDADAAILDLDEQKPKLVFVILTVPLGNPRGITANLLGPIIINPLTKQGKQVILSDDKYTTKHSIMEEILRMKKKS